MALWGCLPLVAGLLWWAATGWSVWIGLTWVVAIAISKALGYGQPFRITSGPDGISFRHFFRTRFIPWADVTRADSPRDEDDGTRLFRVEAHGFSFCGFIYDPVQACLQASVSQHLREHGKPAMTLSRTALTLWTEIPPSIPDEIDWDFRVGRDSSDPPSHFELRKDYLSQFITGKKKANDLPVTAKINPMVIRWSEVTGAKWYHFGEPQWTCLQVMGPGKSKITVPLSRKSRESAAFVLGVIRRLRELEHIGPLPFPPRLVKQSGSQPEEPAAAEE